MTTILTVDSSPRSEASISRQVTHYITAALADKYTAKTLHHDLNTMSLPFLTEDHIGAYFTPATERNESQHALLEASNAVVSDIQQASHLVIGAPMYNFSVSASLKAWIDLLCRVGETFAYTQDGPKGLSNIDHAYIVYASGGSAMGSPYDFLSGYLQQICHFIGVKEVHFIDASGSKQSAAEIIDSAKQQIHTLLS